MTGIQGLRALACALVLLQHSVFFAAYVKGLDYHPYLAINYGRIGVCLFFVISGFVMGGCLREGSGFLVNRIARVFPPFWLAIAVSYLVFSHIKPDWHVDWSSILLLPSTSLNGSYAIPYWTLCYELAFYIVTYLFIVGRLSKKGILSACVIWLTAIIMTDAYRPFGLVDEDAAFSAVAQPGAWILLTPCSIFFIAGLITSQLHREIESQFKSKWMALFCSVMLWGMGNGLKLTSSIPMFLVQAVAFCLAIVAIKDVEVPRLAVRLGNLSYGTYLMHMIPIIALAAILKPHASGIRLSLVWLILVASGGVLGVAFGYLEFALHARVIKPLLRSRWRTGRITTE